MNLLVALGLSIGILAGIWAQVSILPAIALPTFVGVISWACFYAVGGKKEGLLKTVTCNLSGVLWGFVVVLIFKALAGALPGAALGIAVAIGCFIMVIQANIKILSFIPGTFAGAAAFFGTNFDWQKTAIALVIGALLAFLSEVIGTALSNMGKSTKAKS